MPKYFYAVRKGRNIGIYDTWSECEENVKGYKGAEYKKFLSYEEALNFIKNSNEEEKIEIDVENLKENEAIAYVDGSFSLDDFSYSYGIVFITTDGKEFISGKDNDEELSSMRNVSGEIKGAMEAMKLAIEKGKRTLYLYYDYAGIENWAMGTWKVNKDGTKKYKDFFDSIKDKLDVKFIKVKSHSGVEYNEKADRLAKEALEKNNSSL
ncbi:MAG TPA: ribonuclease H family protein [Tissierellaceae bacterium]